MSSTPARSGPLFGSGEAEAHGPARPPREVDADGARLAAVRIVCRGRKDADQDVAVCHGVDRRRGSDEVDPELPIGPGVVVGEVLRTAQPAGARIEHGQVEPEAAVQLHVAVQDARTGMVGIGHRGELALGRIGEINGTLGSL